MFFLSQDDYLFVRFSDENLVAVVSSNWLSSTQADCYWPKKNLTQQVKKRTNPDIESWGVHAVDVLASGGNFFFSVQLLTDISKKAANHPSDPSLP